MALRFVLGTQIQLPSASRAVCTLLSCPDDRHYMDSWGSDKASRLKDKNYFYLGLSHRVYNW